MTARKTLTIAAALLTLGLGACSRSNDEPRPVEENDMQAIDLSEPVPGETPEPSPTPTPSPTPETNLADAAPPPVPPAPDEQMLDDASATGMTARVARDETPAADTAPAEQVERK